MKGTDIFGVFLVIATVSSIAGIWWDWRRRRKQEEKARQLQRWRRYLNETIERNKAE